MFTPSNPSLSPTHTTVTTRVRRAHHSLRGLAVLLALLLAISTLAALRLNAPTVAQDLGSAAITQPVLADSRTPDQAVLSIRRSPKIAGPTLQPREYAVEQEFLRLVNAERSRHGFLPLVLHHSLSSGAAQWTSQMSGQGHLVHAPVAAIRSGGPSGSFRLAENVGRGQSAATLYRAFMASPSHRANILDAGSTHTGVAVVRNPIDGKIYLTQRFASVAGTTDRLS